MIDSSQLKSSVPRFHAGSPRQAPSVGVRPRREDVCGFLWGGERLGRGRSAPSALQQHVHERGSERPLFSSKHALVRSSRRPAVGLAPVCCVEGGSRERGCHISRLATWMATTLPMRHVMPRETSAQVISRWVAEQSLSSAQHADSAALPRRAPQQSGKGWGSSPQVGAPQQEHQPQSLRWPTQQAFVAKCSL